jgi:hypothetical protein
MKNKQPLIFPVVLTYKGTLIQTKGIKCACMSHEIIYKIALPSSLGTTQLCWIIKDGETWKMEFDVAVEPALKTLLINAVACYDETKSFYPGSQRELKSA